jgi:hypothetical protein
MAVGGLQAGEGVMHGIPYPAQAGFSLEGAFLHCFILMVMGDEKWGMKTAGHHSFPFPHHAILFPAWAHFQKGRLR